MMSWDRRPARSLRIPISTAALVKNFDDDLVVFNSDVKLLTGDLQKMDKHLGDYSQKLTDLTTASSKLANSSSDLARMPGRWPTARRRVLRPARASATA